jgi:chaperone required for assembly of F1-ATPase
LKRFYKVAVPGIAAGGDGFTVLLDGRPVRTPAHRLLTVRTRPLADAIAREWADQGERIEPSRMPLTRLAVGALDRVTPHRGDIVDQLARYAGTDLVCYRAPAPADLAARQATAWQPLVDWVGSRFDAPLAVTTDVTPVAQPDAALSGLRTAIEAHDDFELAALGLAVQACGSLVIGLALSHGVVDAMAAGDASQLDEAFQAALWGEDAEAAARRAGLRADIECAAQFLALHRAA